MQQWMDDFGSYGTSANSATYAKQGTPYLNLNPGNNQQFATDPDGVSAGLVIRCGAAQTSNPNNLDNRLGIPTPSTKIGVGARRWYDIMPGSTDERPTVWSFRDNANIRMYDLIVETNGALSIYNSSMTLIATTTAPVISARAWYHIAMKVDTVAGTFRVEIEGNNVASLSIPFTPTSAILFGIGWSSRQDYTYTRVVALAGLIPDFMKDLGLWDTTGSTNNFMPGAFGVYRLPPNADVSSGWTRSTGTLEYPLVAEVGPDDTTFISAGSALPTASIMDVTNVASAVVGVRGLMTLTRLQKSDTGDCTIVSSLVSGASTANGTNKLPSTAYTYFYDIFEFDPATTAAWTPTAVNAVRLKVNRTV